MNVKRNLTALMIGSVAVLVLALWQVVGDAPWEDRVTEAKQWAVGPQGLKGTIGVIGP